MMVVVLAFWNNFEIAVECFHLSGLSDCDQGPFFRHVLFQHFDTKVVEIMQLLIVAPVAVLLVYLERLVLVFFRLSIRNIVP